MESFPIGQGAAAPLRSPGDYEDERRKFGREERIATPAARVRNDGGTRDGERETKTVEYSVYMTATARSFSEMRRRRSSFRQRS